MKLNMKILTKPFKMRLLWLLAVTLLLLLIILMMMILSGMNDRKSVMPVTANSLIPRSEIKNLGIVHFALTGPQIWGLTAFGSDVYSTAAGVYVMQNSQPGVIFAWNTGTDRPSREQYSLGRSFLQYDLSTLPHGTIVSATLELVPITSPMMLGTRAKIYFYAVDWGNALTRDDWNAPLGLLLGTVDPQDHQVNFTTLIGKPVPARLRLTLRTDETINHTGSASTGGAFRVGADQQNTSVLHLWIDTTPGAQMTMMSRVVLVK